MKLINTTIRRNSIAFATIVAISLPGLASAGLGDRVKSRIQTVKTSTGTLVTNVQQHRPLANAVGAAKEQVQEIFDNVKEMNIVEQLRDTMGLIRQQQADYQYFSGGSGCQASCASFRQRLKNVIANYSQLVSEVPALSNARGLVDKLERAANLIDYVPARALYPMWQAMSDRLEDIEAASGQIRETLANLPPLRPIGFGLRSGIPTRSDMLTSSTMSTRSAGGGQGSYCDWANQKDQPWYDAVKGSFDSLSWLIDKIVDMIPDPEVKVQGGGTAGAAVVNAEAAAGVSVKPVQAAKFPLKVISLIVGTISKGMDENIRYSKAVCQ